MCTSVCAMYIMCIYYSNALCVRVCISSMQCMYIKYAGMLMLYGCLSVSCMCMYAHAVCMPVFTAYFIYYTYLHVYQLHRC